MWSFIPIPYPHTHLYTQVMTKICREAEASLDYYAMFKVWTVPQ